MSVSNQKRTKHKPINYYTMVDLDECKNFIAMDKGYPNWETMENWIIDHNKSVDVALLLVSAMEDSCYEYAKRILNK